MARKTLRVVKSAEIIPFNGDVIDVLERALEAAQAGEISHVALCAIRRDGYTVTDWSDPLGVGIIGSLQHLNHEMLKKFEPEE